MFRRITITEIKHLTPDSTPSIQTSHQSLRAREHQSSQHKFFSVNQKKKKLPAFFHQRCPEPGYARERRQQRRRRRKSRWCSPLRRQRAPVNRWSKHCTAWHQQNMNRITSKWRDNPQTIFFVLLIILYSLWPKVKDSMHDSNNFSGNFSILHEPLIKGRYLCQFKVIHLKLQAFHTFWPPHNLAFHAQK